MDGEKGTFNLKKEEFEQLMHLQEVGNSVGDPFYAYCTAAEGMLRGGCYALAGIAAIHGAVWMGRAAGWWHAWWEAARVRHHAWRRLHPTPRVVKGATRHLPSPQEKLAAVHAWSDGWGTRL